MRLLVWLSLAAGCGTRLTEEQDAAIDELAAKARAGASAKDAIRQQAIQHARGEIGPRPDLGPCLVVPKKPDTDEFCMWTQDQRNMAFAGVPITVTKQEYVGSEEGPRYDRIDNTFIIEIEALKTSLDAPKERIAERMDVARQLADEKYLPFDMTLVVDHLTDPSQGSAGDKFETGALSGRLYIWSYEKNQIVCAANVSAENSDTIAVHTYVDDQTEQTKASELDLLCDLYRQAVWRGIDGLASAGPWVAPVEVSVGPETLRPAEVAPTPAPN